MDIESAGQDSENYRKYSAMQSEPPHENTDLFEQILNLNISDHQQYIQSDNQQAKTQRKYNKRMDIRKILNSSGSNDRLLPTSLKHNSSRESSERARNNYETQNSMDEESIRQSFKKRYEESFSVENTIRDSSSSFSEKSESKSYKKILPALDAEEESIMEVQEKKVTCNCKRSQCLKLYCECFQRKLYCHDNCKCYDCGNTKTNHQLHKDAVFKALARKNRGFEEQKERQKKLQFEQGFSLEVESGQIRKGCKCKKTKCLKKYCECFNNGEYCTLFCRCQQCSNKAEHQKVNISNLN